MLNWYRIEINKALSCTQNWRRWFEFSIMVSKISISNREYTNNTSPRAHAVHTRFADYRTLQQTPVGTNDFPHRVRLECFEITSIARLTLRLTNGDRSIQRRWQALITQSCVRNNCRLQQLRQQRSMHASKHPLCWLRIERVETGPRSATCSDMSKTAR
jgi:hypothetical protein